MAVLCENCGGQVGLAACHLSACQCPSTKPRLQGAGRMQRADMRRACQERAR